jgi:hypothetical protein
MKDRTIGHGRKKQAGIRNGSLDSGHEQSPVSNHRSPYNLRDNWAVKAVVVGKTLVIDLLKPVEVVLE